MKSVKWRVGPNNFILICYRLALQLFQLRFVKLSLMYLSVLNFLLSSFIFKHANVPLDLTQQFVRSFFYGFLLNQCQFHFVFG